MSAPVQIAILIGSTRPNRIGPHVSDWLLNLLNSEGVLHNAQFSIVDPAQFALPSFNEPVTPLLVKDFNEFANPTTKTWNHEMAKYDAYIIVSPEYHQGIPGALKNAIDFVYHAWSGKPVMILTYGIFGGIQASQQLHQVLGSGIGMKIASIAPKLEFPGRDELRNNASPALFQAMGGRVADGTFQTWEEKKRKDIVDGCKELLELAKPV
ncbi:uncharacterized protein Z518_09228 [Rhinocladiella mackenziei CBS 650.93]|uniref:Rhinocladiella mackenziei CBS 650.93 unplaced genomic scaffold supercont1.7, whole genome shotgun sequence n=1 Tax=Rhinocladiella mackenziei CBS 650.93 TaxID=1442369 RepID=A0A0D2FHT3_9EURO|nr:uncharacterized protein Z518_09228 [Rhinocladiella mackenziei CBS 650.93]KIX01502.1 hypothetical protein Z518_09228 [Rhinocladiella mackenziei CBS 650.93]